MSWEATLRDRLDRHGPSRGKGKGLPVSIKVRNVGGCFDCGGCNPHATKVIEQLAQKYDGRDGLRIERHETGPEVIVYLAFGTVVIGLTAQVVNLITAIIKARSEGKTKGDKAEGHIEIIVRGFDQNGKIFDERVLKLPPGDTATRDVVRKALTDGLQQRLLPPPDQKPTKKRKGTKAKKKPGKGVFSDSPIEEE